MLDGLREIALFFFVDAELAVVDMLPLLPWTNAISSPIMPLREWACDANSSDADADSSALAALDCVTLSICEIAELIWSTP